MDLLSFQDRKKRLGDTMRYHNAGHKEERVMDIVKQVRATKPIKNRWGDKVYPIDLSNYGEFITTLQSLSWVLEEMGFDIRFMTSAGTNYACSEYYMHDRLFDPSISKVVCLVALSDRKDGPHFKFARDGKKLVVKSYTNTGQALAPMSKGPLKGAKEISRSTVKKLIDVMNHHTNLDPEDENTWKNFGRAVSSDKLTIPNSSRVSLLKQNLKTEFRKAN